MFILTQIKRKVLVHRTCIAAGKILYNHLQSLLVLLKKLRLIGIDHAGYSRRYHIVHRFLLVVFFVIHSSHIHSTAHRRCFAIIKILLISSPFSAGKFESCETKYNRFLEIREIHTHETNAIEIVYISHLARITFNWYAEQIPGNFCRFSVTQIHTCGTFIYDIVLAHLHAVRRQMYAVLEIFLVFVKSIVLVYILYVGG